MARILTHVEGETEETFVRELLAPHLLQFGHEVSPRLMGNARLRSRRGGIRGWNGVSMDIINHLKSDPACYATTMVDYYALPQSGARAWPGRARASTLPFAEKAPTIEQALLADISRRMGSRFNRSRFIPFLIMHEFEGLLFSDCDRFALGIGKQSLALEFHKVRQAFSSPEEINDSPITAPSKRVVGLVPDYQKPLMGALAALEIGLAKIRTECPHFDSWVATLEALQ